jgi:hypothetical protein
MKKMTVWMLAATIGVVFTHAAARDRNNGYMGPTHDLQSGNTYYSHGNGYRGYNSNTGSQWNATSSGSIIRGTDANGNAWSYDRNTGNYYNYGTGEMRQHGRKW